MSWQTWIDRMESGSICEYAGIFGRAGGLWAQTDAGKNPAFVFPESECIKFATIMDNEDKSLCISGATLNGKKFFCTQVDKECIIFQGKQDNKDDSLVVCSSAQALVIGYNGSTSVKTNQVRNAVEAIKDYFRTIGY